MTGLAADLKLLRDQVAQGREAADRARTELGVRIGQIGERAQRHEGEMSAKLAASATGWNTSTASRRRA